MINSFFTVAYRNLRKNRLVSSINIGGLAIGLTASMLLACYVHHELSFDRFHENADRIVRVVFRANINGGEIKEPFAMPPTAAALKQDYPEVEKTARLRIGGQQHIVQGDKQLRGAEMAIVDPSFFDIFSLPLLHGDATKGLAEPNTVVIAASWAERIFGKNDPVGQWITLKNWKEKLRVVGVIQDLPTNSSIRFDLFTSMVNMPEAKSDSWMQSEFYTWLLLQKGYDYKQLEAKLPQTVEKYMGPQFQAALGMSLTDFKGKGNQIGLFLQPLTDIHLYSDFGFDLQPGGNVRYVWLFGSVAIFLLLIACINFVNLSTAGASKRAKEVGVRKAIGSSKGSLIAQFLSETMTMTVIAFVLALGMVVLAFPYFQDFTEKTYNLSFIKTPGFGLSLAGLCILIGLLAGLYPAFLMSGFKPVSILKGNKHVQNNAGLRGGLVVLQFVISTGLMIGTTVVYRQMAYMQNKKLGYDKNSVLVLENTWQLGEKEATFREQLRQDPAVTHISTSAFRPVGPSGNNNAMVFPDQRSGELTRMLRFSVDEQYIPTLGMNMVSGRNFSADLVTDSSAVIINQAAATAFGWGNDALNHTLTWSNSNRTAPLNVIGVVADFHFKSFHESITPLMMVVERSSGLIVRVKSGDASHFVSKTQEQWQKMGMEEPLEYGFMDDYFQKTYRAEQKTGMLMAFFAALTILIACLGLFGLAVFMAEQRTKEIGIRKVLGASIANVAGLLAKDFLKLVLLAIVIASPLAWYFMQQWLDNFAYRIEIQWWMFAVAGILALVIAFLTVGSQAAKAALANPVKSLRSE